MVINSVEQKAKEDAKPILIPPASFVSLDPNREPDVTIRLYNAAQQKNRVENISDDSGKNMKLFNLNGSIIFTPQVFR